MSNKIRFKFIRGEEVKYISHLDLMRFFDRALRRCDLPIAYSIGFNPHPQMIFGLPLTVGVTSECEYADFEFSEPVNTDDFVGRLTPQLPEGIRITEAKIKYSKPNIMAVIDFASYTISVNIESINSADEFQKKLDEFLKDEKIIVKKEGKNGTKLIDIKPLIQEIKVIEAVGGTVHDFCIDAYVCAGNTFNLRPDLLIKALSDKWGIEITVNGIHRTGLFARKNGKDLKPLDEEMICE